MTETAMDCRTGSRDAAVLVGIDELVLARAIIQVPRLDYELMRLSTTWHS